MLKIRVRPRIRKKGIEKPTLWGVPRQICSLVEVKGPSLKKQR
jgi:hypothetical protein